MTIDDEETFSTFNEFRSDTFTVPTRAMIEASLLTSTYGDSVYKEDEVTLSLEDKMVQITGKPAALFCVSGTMSNQVGLRANLVQPPYSVLCDHRAHVFLHEAAGLAMLSQAMVHPVAPANGNYLTYEEVIANVTLDDGDIHAAPTKVISLENTLHGIIMPIEEIKKISAFCKANDIRLHLDGARLWNASVATGISIKEYCSYFDSVSLCLSKSLGAPIGSILVGEKKFIEKANHFKKQCGGGIRQAGIVTSMAIHAIDQNFSKLAKSHEYAKQVGDFCAEHGIILESPVDTSFVFLDLKANKMDDKYLIELGRTKYNIKLMGGRIAFHFQLSQRSVDNVKKCILECYQYNQAHPHEYDIKNNKKMYNYDSIKGTV
ncbi:threonine aldolase [Scheffersomyces xylosifermentans]|uniref:threonine aldolase n=1 Tax=Scheffersomyces xylosifermentans TaxID=1304137 RepID=UPI00315DF7D1